MATVALFDSLPQVVSPALLVLFGISRAGALTAERMVSNMASVKSKKASQGENLKEVFCRFIRKNGKVIYPKKGHLFHFWVKV